MPGLDVVGADRDTRCARAARVDRQHPERAVAAARDVRGSAREGDVLRSGIRRQAPVEPAVPIEHGDLTRVAGGDPHMLSARIEADVVREEGRADQPLEARTRSVGDVDDRHALGRAAEPDP